LIFKKQRHFELEKFRAMRQFSAVFLSERIMNATTRHCHRCGWEWTLAGQPGRSESGHRCNADLRVCLNCVSYDARVAQQCRDRRAELEQEKAVGNFCEYFAFARRVFVAKEEKNPREAAARDQMKKLFGD